MLITFYAAVAIAVAVAALMFAEWVCDPDAIAPDRPCALAIVAGLLWPVLAVGLMQWFLIAGFASRVREAKVSAAGLELMSMPVRIDAKP
jgi:hypothetical protein